MGIYLYQFFNTYINSKQNPHLNKNQQTILMNTQFISQTITKVIPNGVISGILFGSGLCYTIQNEKYWHIPCVLFFPATYAGYQMYKNKDDVIIPYVSKAKNTYFT